MGLIDVRRAIINAQDQFLPPEYQRVDWLETLGRQARIDTGVGGNDTTLRLQFLFMPVVLNMNYHPLFGNYGGEKVKGWRLITRQTSESSYYTTFILGLGIRKVSSSSRLSPCGNDSFMNKKIEADMEYGKCTMIGTQTVTTISTDDGSPTNNIHIAIGSSSPTSDSASTSKWRIYYFKIHSHGVLIRNYIPCYRKSDNKAGFYDTVNHTFNPSIGSAEFVAGND